jgi:uncharacterized membrane protein
MTAGNFYDNIGQITRISQEIVDKENTRLDKKAQGIYSAYNSQQRMIFLNQSYTMRMRAYSYMFGVISVTIVLVVLLGFLRGILPGTLVDVLMIVIIAGGIIWTYLIFADIQNRDQIDYNQIASGSSSLLDPKNIDTAKADAANKGDISTLSGDFSLMGNEVCIGRDCCPTDWSTGLSPGLSYYNTNQNKCLIKGAATETAQP